MPYFESDHFIGGGSITSEAWKRVTRSARRAEVLKQLDSLGLLRRDNEGGATVVTKLPGGQTARLYFVDARIVTLTDDCGLPEHLDAAVDASKKSKRREEPL